MNIFDIGRRVKAMRNGGRGMHDVYAGVILNQQAYKMKLEALFEDIFEEKGISDSLCRQIMQELDQLDRDIMQEFKSEER